MSEFYKMQVNETIRDAVINGSGSMSNWDAICQANEFTTWTPALNAGDLVLIPDTVTRDANVLQDKDTYPASNGTIAGALAVLQTVFDLINDRWILKTGFWDDSGIWIDTETWNDSI